MEKAAEPQTTELCGGPAAPLTAETEFSECAPMSSQEDSASPGCVGQQPSPKRRKESPDRQSPSDGSSQGEQQEAAEDEVEDAATAEEAEKVWSTMLEIDPGFPFSVVWPSLKGSVYKALRSVHHTWQEVGWRSGEDMEVSLQHAVELYGFGAIARHLNKSQAESVAQELEGQVQCSVRLDRDGAAAAPEIPQGQRAAPSDAERREKIRQRIRELQEGPGGRALPDPIFADILNRVERDIERDERWLPMAHAMERMLDLMQAYDPEAAGGRTPSGVPLRMGLGRPRAFTINVERARLLSSALWPVVSAAPEELRQGRFRVQYRAEEGEDGEGGGGVSRAFLTHAGGLLAEPELGLLLPAPGGHVSLSPLPGVLAPLSRDDDSVATQRKVWLRFFGRLLGMSVVHECPLGFLLVPSLCKQLLSEETSFEDLLFVPGLSDGGGSGWYQSLRPLLAHHAPHMVPEDPTLARMDAAEVDAALAGLEAVMPSRAQQVFEAWSLHLANLAAAPLLAAGRMATALALAARLLRTAATPSQRLLALTRARELAERVATEAQRPDDFSPEAVHALRSLVGALRTVSAGSGQEASEAEEMLRQALVRTLGVGDTCVDAESNEDDESLPPSAPSDLKPLRPNTIPSISDWFTTGAKDQMRRSGRLYHEVVLGNDFFDTAPQIGWLTEDFAEREYDANGVGDDAHGWGTDGVRHKKWHEGASECTWPRAWAGSDVIGFALDINAGRARFSLNGEWVPSAEMICEPEGRAIYPAVSMKGRFKMNLLADTWRFSPPDEGYQGWASSGVFTRLVPPAELETPPSFERSTSLVSGPGVPSGELSAASLPAFATAVARQALTENLQPHLDVVIEEFRQVVPPRTLQGLTWKQLQDRVSGQRLCPEDFVREWRSRTTYQCCDAADDGVTLWWSYVADRNAEELQQLFSWCTGFAAIPVTAWRFMIKAIDDSARCPSINTCMTDDVTAANRGVKMPTLYLPAYDSKATLAQKMEWAVAGASSLNLH